MAVLEALKSSNTYFVNKYVMNNCFTKVFIAHTFVFTVSPVWYVSPLHTNSECLLSVVYLVRIKLWIELTEIKLLSIFNIK